MSIAKQLWLTAASILLVATAAACSKDDEATATTSATTSRIVSTEKVYNEGNPYNSRSEYTYDAQGRIVAGLVVTAPGTELERSASYTLEYADDLITYRTNGSTIKYHLEGGRIVSVDDNYYGHYTMVYDAEGHAVRECYENGDTIFYEWADGDLVRSYCHKNSAANEGIYDVTTHYTFTTIPTAAFPATDCGIGLKALAMQGFFGRQSLHLMESEQYVIADNGDRVEGHSTYTYQLDSQQRVTSANVETESLPYTIRVAWSE